MNLTYCFIYNCVFPQNLPHMEKIQDMPHSETNGSNTIQEQDVPVLPQDTEPPPGPVSPESPEPSAGPHSLDNHLHDNKGKNKRRKISLTDHQNMVKNVELAVTNNNTPPPLIHTANSMFNMLCDTFDKEFPNCLPRYMRDQCISTIINNHEQGKK
jgi:hypothetical protein